MLEFSGKKYQPLPTTQPSGQIPSEDGRDHEGEKKGPRVSSTTIYLIVEAVVLLVLFSLYNRWNYPTHGDASHQDRYFDLRTYNSTKHFTEDLDLMIKSPAADKFWTSVQETHGVVSVPTDWALNLGFEPSLESPEMQGHSIYQVDMFHSLHCLSHIRNRLISKLSLEEWPRDDVHSLHCINFLRQQITCHADITLQGTDDYLHFSKNKGHQCRDHDALLRWTREHSWASHMTWVKDNYGVE